MNYIEFPGLGELSFNIDPVAIKIGGLAVYWYGILIATGFMLAVILAMRHSKKFGIDPEHIIDLILFVAPVSLVSARLYYVIFSWEHYRDNLWKIFSIREGGLAIYGGIIGGLIVAYVFAKKKKIGVWKLFDFGIPYVALAQAIGRWGNFVNQEAFGTNTTLPWGMTGNKIEGQLRALGLDPGVPVHPTFLYESLWNFGVFFLLLWFRRRKKLDGEVFFLYMIIYGIGRSWIELLRTDSLMIGSTNIRVSFVLSLLLAGIFGVLFVMWRKKASQEPVGEIFSGYGGVLQTINGEQDGVEHSKMEEGRKGEDVGKQGIEELDGSLDSREKGDEDSLEK